MDKQMTRELAMQILVNVLGGIENIEDILTHLSRDIEMMKGSDLFTISERIMLQKALSRIDHVAAVLDRDTDVQKFVDFVQG